MMPLYTLGMILIETCVLHFALHCAVHCSLISRPLTAFAGSVKIGSGLGARLLRYFFCACFYNVYSIGREHHC